MSLACLLKYQMRCRAFSELSKAHANGPKKPPPPSLFTASVAASVAACTAVAELTAAPAAASAAADAALDTASDGPAAAAEATSPSVSRLVVSRAARWSSADGVLPALAAMPIRELRTTLLQQKQRQPQAILNQAQAALVPSKVLDIAA